MKKLCLILIISALFVFAGCGNGTDDIYDYGDSQNDNTDSDKTDSDNTDTDKTDSDNTDSDNTDSDNPDTDNPDTDNPDTDNPDTDNPDTDNPDTDNPDTDNPDTDNPDTDNPDTDNPDTDNPDTDNPDTDNPDTDNPDTDNPDTDNPDTDNPDTDNPDTDNPDTDNPDTDDPGIVCTGISLDTDTFYAYVDGIYLGYVTDGILGDASVDDMVFLGFYGGISDGSYDLASEANGNYESCTECMRIFQDYGTGAQKIFFQESGTIEVSNYNPDNYGMSAVISAKLVESTFSNSHSTPVENGACIEIEAGVANAIDDSGNDDTCADLMDCIDACADNDDNCPSECYYGTNAVARTQYQNLAKCDEDNNCGGNYYCYWEHCLEQEAICGMAPDTDNYNIPYGQVTINGTFTYLNPEEGISINLNTQAIKSAFATGTFGNNNTNIVDTTGTVYSYAKISHFKDDEDTKNITLIQTYQEDGQSHTPTVHFVTTVTEPGEYTLGLGEWTNEARIFVSETNSDGERSCDHAFGVGTVTISAISWDTGATEISVSGSATLYSYKSAPHYGGNIADDTTWKACEPK